MIYSGLGSALLKYIRGESWAAVSGARLKYFDASGNDITSNLIGQSHVTIPSASMGTALNKCIVNTSAINLGTFQTGYVGLLEYRYFSSLDEPWFGSKVIVDIANGTVANVYPSNLTLCLNGPETYMANLLLDYVFKGTVPAVLTSVYMQLLDGSNLPVSDVVQAPVTNFSAIYQNEFNLGEMAYTAPLTFTLSTRCTISKLRIATSLAQTSPIIMNYPMVPMDFEANSSYTIDAGKLLVPVLSESLSYFGAYVYDWLSVPSFLWLNMSDDIWRELNAS